MSDIEECGICGKRTDYWTEVLGVTVEGDNSQRRWRTIICSECRNRTTVDEADSMATEHISQRS